MKNILSFLVLILVVTSCGKEVVTDDKKDRTISYEVDGDPINFGADDIIISEFQGIFAITGTDSQSSTSAVNNEISFTWLDPPTEKLYDGEGVSVNHFYMGGVALESEKNLLIDVTENSEEYFRATFQFDEPEGLGTKWLVRNGVIDIEK